MMKTLMILYSESQYGAALFPHISLNFNDFKIKHCVSSVCC